MRCKWCGQPHRVAIEALRSCHSFDMLRRHWWPTGRAGRNSARWSACAVGKESVPLILCWPVAMQIVRFSKCDCCTQDILHNPPSPPYHCSDHHLDMFRPGSGRPRHKSHDSMPATAVYRATDHQRAVQMRLLHASFQQVASDCELCNIDHMHCI